MKKIFITVCILITTILIVGCDSGKETANPKVSDIVNKMKEKIKETTISELEKEKENTTAKERKKNLTKEIEELKKTPKEAAPISMQEINLIKTENEITKNGTLNKEELLEGVMLESQANIRSDKIIILKAKDDKTVQELKIGLDKIKFQQEESWKSYLPDEYKKVQEGIVKINGKYLVYIVSSNVKELEKIFDEGFSKK